MREKKEIHKLSWLSIIWILKTLNSVQTLNEDIPEIKLSHWYLVNKSYKKSHSKTQTLIVLNKFVCSRINGLIPFQILSYWAPTLVNPISSLSYIYIKFCFFLLAFSSTDSILKSTQNSQCRLSRLSIQNNQWNISTAEQKSTIVMPSWSNF